MNFWDEIDAFQTSLKLSEGRPAYTFIDGPPFATGLPHYGHILAGTIKDVVTRFASLNGFHVERKFGWDCHGLPVEYEIDKKFNITCKADVMKMGIPQYNAECRSIVSRYASEWESTVRRMARWIDFKNDYKTMYPQFMESIWWVFKTLFGKNQIYRGFRVMPFSTACNTPLSNFEVALNYKDVQDPSLTITCPVVGEEGIFQGAAFLVWTTTPWTLPSNLALAVHPELEYVLFEEVKEGGRRLIALKDRLPAYFKDVAKEVKIISTHRGSELVGLSYEAPFDYFVARRESFPKTHTVLAAEYVTAESGTGIVHQAPGFGEDDFSVCLGAGIISEIDVPCPVDEAGCYTAPIPETLRGEKFLGRYVKDADSMIIKDLETRGRVFLRTTLTHSYPFCWRSDTPLLYKTVPCWFVRVRSMIPQMLEASAKSRWVPDFVQEKRFHNWIASAHDWAISRNRYWGTPIPLWANEDFSEIICIGSIEELERLTGVSGIKDLHRESIDHLTIPSRDGKGVLRRVEEVLDCWFESGSVPYAQLHYPFENKEKFEASFPYDFIGEGLDQTRGWFYTLVVLGTHLFGKCPFRNLICNGLVLASDGKKMSKRLKNYPEPGLIFEQHGADALRLYLINSPVVRAEALKFREEGVKDIVKDVLLPWWNSYRFLAAQIDLLKDFKYDPSALASENVMNRWILASLQSLLKTVRTEMEAYRLYAVLPPCLRFLEALTNWYIRFNRRRFKGEVEEDPRAGLNILFHVLLSFSQVMAPFAPMLSENVYQRLRPFITKPVEVVDDRSIHFLLYPRVEEALIDEGIERSMAALQQVVEAGRILRKCRDIPLKAPLSGMTVVSADAQFRADVAGLEAYALEELNVRSLRLDADESAYGIAYRAVPNFKGLGARLKGDLPKVQAALKTLSQAQMAAFMESGSIEVAGHVLSGEDLQVTRFLEDGITSNPDIVAQCDRSVLVLLDCRVDDELRSEGLAREFINRVQRLRKAAGLKAADLVAIEAVVTADPEGELKEALAKQKKFISTALKQESEHLRWEAGDKAADKVIMEADVEISSATLKLSLLKL